MTGGIPSRQVVRASSSSDAEGKGFWGTWGAIVLYVVFSHTQCPLGGSGQNPLNSMEE